MVDMNSEAVIQLENLSKVYGGRDGKITALQDINLTVMSGEFVCIVGPSGCGKSTLLRILAGLDRQTGGRVIIRQADKNQPLSSMVFQGDSLFPWMTVIDNVAYGLAMRKIPRAERYRTAKQIIDKIGLTNFIRAYPHQLSGGMRQRVNVARAFANDPQILLMDEPFGALDEQNRIMLQEELLTIWEGSGKTTVFITHSIDEALILGDRVVVMTASPGRVKEDVPIHLPRPRNMSDIRSDERFIKLYQRIWCLLKDEVHRRESEPCLKAVKV